AFSRTPYSQNSQPKWKWLATLTLLLDKDGSNPRCSTQESLDHLAGPAHRVTVDSPVRKTRWTTSRGLWQTKICGRVRHAVSGNDGIQHKQRSLFVLRSILRSGKLAGPLHR